MDPRFTTGSAGHAHVPKRPNGVGALDRKLITTSPPDQPKGSDTSGGRPGPPTDDGAGQVPVRRLAGVLRPRRGLPSSRAVVGGLLVAVALVGTWWSASGGGSGHGDRYLVVSHPVGPGERLDRSDLGWLTADLPDRLRSRAYTDPASVLGQVTTAPLERGDLVQASSIVRSPGDPGNRELSFVVDTDWAVGGTLRPGDRIDLLVTYGAGLTSETRTVLADTSVRRVSAPGGDSLGSTRTQAITVAIDDPEQVRAATNAARAGTVTVVRSTGAVDVSSITAGETAVDATGDATDAAAGSNGRGEQESSTKKRTTTTTTRRAPATTTTRPPTTTTRPPMTTTTPTTTTTASAAPTFPPAVTSPPAALFPSAPTASAAPAPAPGFGP